MKFSSIIIPHHVKLDSTNAMIGYRHGYVCAHELMYRRLYTSLRNESKLAEDEEADNLQVLYIREDSESYIRNP